MPLTALRNGDLIDASRPDLGQPQLPLSWADVYRRRPRADLRCRDCGTPMCAKVSSLKLRFFAHLRRPATCVYNGETVAHHQLKTLIAEVARSAGWDVEVEAVGPDWRADVLTVSPEGDEKIAWEVQRSPIAAGIAEERMLRHDKAGVTTIWIARRNWPWSRPVRTLVVAGSSEPWVVSGRLADWQPILHPDGRKVQWNSSSAELRSVVRQILLGDLTCHKWKPPDATWRIPFELGWVPLQAADTWCNAEPQLPERLMARLELKWTTCYRCDQLTAAVVGLIPIDPSTGREYEAISTQHEKILDRVWSDMRGVINRSEQLPIGVIKRRSSKQMGVDYVSNGCYSCDTILGNQYLYGAAPWPWENKHRIEPEVPDAVRDQALLIGPLDIGVLRKMLRQASSVRTIPWLPH